MDSFQVSASRKSGNRFPGYGTGLVRIYLDIDLESLFGEKFFDVLRPFHYAEISAVEIVVKSDLDSFLKPVDAVEVKMVHRLAVSAHVFVDDGECR